MRLSQELRPLLSKSGARVVAVSSGGMLNVKYDHGYATGTKGSYDKQLSYAYAKRGQAWFENRNLFFMVNLDMLWSVGVVLLSSWLDPLPPATAHKCAGSALWIFGQSARRTNHLRQLPPWLDRYTWRWVCLRVHEARLSMWKTKNSYLFFKGCGGLFNFTQSPQKSGFDPC